MNPWVVRFVTWPLHQLKANRRVLPWYRQLLKSQWWSPERLRAWQKERVRHILQHAACSVPYYREQLSTSGIDSLGWAQWRCLPLLTKAEVREQLDRLKAMDRARVVSAVQTSGATGMPVTWLRDCRTQDAHQAVKLRNLSWWGFHIGDRHVWLWGRDEFQGRRKALRDLLVYNKRVLGLLDLSEETIEEFYHNLTKWKPSYLYGYSSGLVQLARLCGRHGHDLKLLRLRGVINTAEMLTATQRRYLRQVFGCPVINEYGCSETQIIAFECPQGNMHINADALLVEFLRDGQPVEPGELGEIVVTDLFNEAMPLIRYRTGDLGRPKSGRCPCGRALPMMELAVGRELEMVRLSDGRIIHPEVFTPPHDNPLFSLVERFRVIQESPVRFRVQVVSQPDKLEEVRHHFVNLIESQLGNSLQIEVERVAEIPHDPSGKLRYFVSALEPESAFAEVA